VGNSTSSGLQITPLVLWVTAALGGALWAVLVALALDARQSTAAMQKSVTTLVTSQEYDRREIDAVKVDVRSVSDRVTVLERAK
jgi:hypothetical protein